MRVAVKEAAAALMALGAYVATVLPGVRRELRRWRKLAEAIPDPERRHLALASLEEKRSNVEAVAVFATLAALYHRRAVLRAIVPLQVAIDFRDTLEELDADEGTVADGYFTALETGWVREIETLAGCGAVAPRLREAAERCKEGQRRTHAAAGGEFTELKSWAESLEAAGYRWWELAAGASSSVAAHALIAAAADPAVSAATAASVDAAYNPSIGALTVLLDDLVDREVDREAGEHNYLAYYENAGEAAERLGWIAREASAHIEALPRAGRHRAILAGVGAFYLSAAEVRTPYADPIRHPLLTVLGPGTRVLTAFMRMRRRGERKRPGQAGNLPGR